MRTVFSPKGLINRFNDHVRIFPDHGFYYALDPDAHLDHQKAFSLTGTIPVDVIIVGPCSNYEHGDPVTFIEERIRTVPGNPKNILVLPGCCRDYGDETKNLIRAINPALNWIIPEGVPDFCNNESSLGDLAEYLIRIGLVQQNDRVEAPAAQ